MINYKEACETIRASLTQGETQTMAMTRAGVSETAFYKWKQTKPDFAKLIKDAKEAYRISRVYDATTALHKVACGFETTEIRTEYGVGANGQPIITKQVKTIKLIPPNVQALKEVLHNLAPEEWGNTPVDDSFAGVRVEVVTQSQKEEKK